MKESDIKKNMSNPQKLKVGIYYTHLQHTIMINRNKKAKVNKVEEQANI